MTEVHKICEIWQERPGEISYKCSCGTVSKHQEFGPIAVCPDYARTIRVPIRLEAWGQLTMPSGTPMTPEYIREHWAELEIETVAKVKQIGNLEYLRDEPEKQPPTLSSVIRDDAADRQRDDEIIENLLNHLEERLYRLEAAEREGRLEKTVVSEAVWSALSAVRSLAQIVEKMRKS